MKSVFGLELAVVPLLSTAVFDGVKISRVRLKVLEGNFVLTGTAWFIGVLSKAALTGSILNPGGSLLVRLPLQDSRVLADVFDTRAFHNFNRVINATVLLSGIFAGCDAAIGILLGSWFGLALS